jgi:hypothetical protein
VYVTGWSQGIASVDYATIKYDISGQEIWTARYDGPGGGLDQTAPFVGGASVGTSGNYIQNNQGLIVTTEVLDPAPEVPYLASLVSGLRLNRGLTGSLLAKLDHCLASLGAANAAARQDAANVLGAFVNQVQELAVEGLVSSAAAAELTAVAGQIRKGVEGTETTVVYVTGQSTGADNGLDFATVKYNGDDGRPMWNLPGQPGTTPAKPGNPPNIALRYDSPAHLIDRGFAMAMNVDGELYVAGPSAVDPTKPVTAAADFLTIKYFVNTFQPVSLAEARYDGPVNGLDVPCGFATWRDPASGRLLIFRDPETGGDYVAVTGNSAGASGVAEYITAVYDNGLLWRWLQRYYW